MNLEEQSHRRLNILTGEWTLVSPHRAKRPWQGQVEPPAEASIPDYDPTCYLCPGNERAGGVRNPQYTQTFVFDNDFAALLPGEPGTVQEDDLLVAEVETGVCRVVCFSPRHDLTLAQMEPADIRPVVDVWAEQHAELATRGDIAYVQIFENRGAMMGCSNPHPHCQIWATSSVPDQPAKESLRQAEYFRIGKSAMLGDYLALELEKQERIVLQNDSFVALVPYWAFWPFEILLLPRKPVRGFEDLTDQDRDLLADILHRLTAAYDRLFSASFPYSMGFHPAPVDGGEHPGWVFHAHFYPPLLRSATVKKFMVGFEMLGTPQRDITPEAAAARLREVAALS